ncbi:magnesium chelatase subunit D [Lutibacter agarilyticus]|uniref:Magnesium chelatase subunit D n=1 Tax=Lutibacter agarilyticus TaxID=1109740 RepID=A0A238WZ86_9FLAO|nr:AAA family ATPase [Lutibacter agarilyticus]SNR51534.1 magnesium chelatase subunit D [Lutibacter agarilyticus]
MKTLNNIFPFSAIVGQDDFKLALLLNVIDPLLGGVLAIGDKGTGKTTLIRSLAHLIEAEDSFPFVNLPIGVSEDRVLGHVNLEKLINEKREQVQLGLLAKAHKGCLYIDEINLLNDYLMDVLLDASATGSYHLEREGISKTIESRFCLIGSMNPEEGDLRPQLKDRFGLSVVIKTAISLEERTQIISNRLQFDDHPQDFVTTYAEKQEKIVEQIKNAQKNLKSIKIDESLYEIAANLALINEVEGHRADILLLKTSRAYAAYLSDTIVEEFHLQKIAPFVLNHRSNNGDFSKEQSNSKEEQQQEQQHQEQQEENSSNSSQQEHTFQSIIPANERKHLNGVKAGSKNGANTKSYHQQNQLTESPSELKNIDNRKTVSQYLATDKFEIKNKFQQSKTQPHLIFLLDSSGSMLKEKVVAYAKGLVEKFAKSESGLKPIYSLISLYNGDADLIQDSSKDMDELLEKLKDIKTGGKTNIIPAFKRIKALTNNSKDINYELIIITDGKFNTDAENAFDEAVIACQTYCKSVHQLTVVDAEKGLVKLNLAQKFATKIRANYEPLMLQNG